MAAYFNKLRVTEFKRLDRQDHVYLDYAGAAMYPQAIVRNHQKLLYQVFGDPQSTHSPASLTSELVEQTRTHVLHFFNADPRKYTIIFTGSATAAIKLVAEAYPFRRGASLVLSADNHDSVNGVHEYARRAGATTRTIPLDPDFRMINTEQYLRRWRKTAPGLFAFPAQSNFTGVKHPLELVDVAHNYGYDVLLDVACFVPTNKLDLSQCKADFVSVSFYKMFGYPTGLGALIANRAALCRLQRPWFSSGTTSFVSTQLRMHSLGDEPYCFEDGGLDFLGIGAVTSGLDFLNEIGMSRVSKHISELTEEILKGVKDIRYGNGSRMVMVYGPEKIENRGGIVTFDVVRKDGTRVDAAEVARVFNERHISVGAGMICNAGCAEYAYRLSKSSLSACVKHMDKVTIQQLSECLGITRMGSIRVSLGVGSVMRDVKGMLGVLREFCADLAEQDVMLASDLDRKPRGESFDVQPVKTAVRRLSLRRRQWSEV